MARMVTFSVSAEIHGLAADAPVGADDDLGNLLLRVAQLGFAMPFQGGTPFIELHRLVELAFALLERTHQRLQLAKRFLKAHLGDVCRDLGLSHAKRALPSKKSVQSSRPARREQGQESGKFGGFS